MLSMYITICNFVCTCSSFLYQKNVVKCFRECERDGTETVHSFWPNRWDNVSRLNDLIVIQTEFRQSFLSAHPLIFDEVELKWFLNQFRIQFTKCVKNREHRYQFPMPVHGANWEFWSISWFPPTAAIVGSGKMGKAWGFKKLIWFPSLNKKAKHWSVGEGSLKKRMFFLSIAQITTPPPPRHFKDKKN